MIRSLFFYILLFKIEFKTYLKKYYANRKLSATSTYICIKKRLLRGEKMPKIDVSFRKTTRDMELYLEVMKRERNEKSEFVKNAIEFYMKHLEKEKENVLVR